MKYMMKIPPVKPIFDDNDRKIILKDINNILVSGILSDGNYTKELENKFAEYVGTKYAVAVNSGTAALELSIKALSMGKIGEVIVPVMTMNATAASVLTTSMGRLKPVFVDIDKKTLCLDFEKALEKVNSNTVGMIVVDNGGFIFPKYDELMNISADKNFWVITDAAHSHGSRMNNKKAGSFATASAFSFYATKVMFTGEGGIVTTDDNEINNKIRILRNQGKHPDDSELIIELASNNRITEIQAAIGLRGLNRLDDWINNRSKISELYKREIKKRKLPVEIFEPFDNIFPNWYKFIVFLPEDVIPNRDEIKQKMKEHGISLQSEVFKRPLNLMPIWQKMLNTKENDFPVAEELAKRMICLPIYPSLTEDEATYVIDKFEEVLQ